MNIEKKKKELIKIANTCTDLAVKHKLARTKFDDLFEEIYGTEFDTEMDDIVECIDYGNSSVTLKNLEENILWHIESCNGNYNKNEIKNLDANSQQSEKVNDNGHGLHSKDANSIKEVKEE